ncbi:Pre-rRNA-processing protein las1 [Psilocybe cubensis]|uniref:Pre-rRNA-processing protein las1 n=2 Tax=Psilocybe cubensis TaxID=181762 RepID=A0ACB8HG39_PSICU|nr:Pre-rRNA-processing protein las1 [Psilocybe cubensis]KAH9486690.1 Pre-rRNA-processing protein las1 [Psilocybe cubensis]
MRLPRRVPWSSPAELEQLCASIYGDENDIDSKIFAINRISAWKVITSLPHALESTLAILVVIVHDKRQESFSKLLLRQSYANAILRLVNGLVDPLQVGTYARSITSIAQQLGIPNWLVELRHASTHEDLPSLDLLREAARQSMAWLLHNYFLPTINPLTNALHSSSTVRPLSPMLKMYRNTMKVVTRDASLVSQYKSKLVNLMRDIERWIAETKVVANISSAEFGWIGHSSVDSIPLDEDVKEVWALEKFCDALAEKGMLVPLSRKKRQYSTDTLTPSKTSIALWDPLIEHVQAIHPDFSYVFCRRFCSILITSISRDDVPQTTETKNDPSYQDYIACWVVWMIQIWREDTPTHLDLKRYVVSVLMKGLGHEVADLPSRSAIVTLLKKISAGQRELEMMTQLIINRPKASVMVWKPDDLEVMKERHNILQSYESFQATSNSTEPAATTSQQISIPGWHAMDENAWRPCPIGVYKENR